MPEDQDYNISTAVRGRKVIIIAENAPQARAINRQIRQLIAGEAKESAIGFCVSTDQEED